jgi:ElaB/YqjD/DUF883 family membrane-anchored ribosome-binding protein
LNVTGKGKTMEATMRQATDIPEVNREKLAQDLRALIRDAEELLRAGVTDGGQSKIDELKSRLRATVGHVRESYHHIEEKAVAGAKAADQVVRSHPYQFLGAAFGVGLLIGVLAARK